MPDLQNILLDHLHARCADGPISYRDYIEIALYAEGCGYYAREAERVGRSEDRDFYTAESLGRVFAQLVVTAAEDLLPDGVAGASTFIEIAAEPERSLLGSLDTHPFAADRVLRLGDAIEAKGSVVLFANEWLDALPFHRLIFKEGRWRERGVRLSAGGLEEVLLEEYSPALAAAAHRLPVTVKEGYQLDLPLETEAALKSLLAEDWTGLLLLFDYGKIWKALIEDCPNGTARTYFRQEQGNDLLETPGERDITCDVCWTPLLEQLEQAGLMPTTLESQESFLVKRGARAAEAIIEGSGGPFSADRHTLMQLVHPANMGQRFQALWGLRSG